MEVDVKIAGTNYTGVPYITLPLTAGGSVKFCEVSDTTATAGDVASGKTFYTADGELETGTASVGGDASKSFTVVQKPHQTLSVIPGGSGAELFSTSTDSSGNVVYKTEYPSKIIVGLEPNYGYNAGKITINGVEKDSDTVNPIQYYSDLVDGMVISATDATAISSESFTDVTLNLIGGYSIDNPILRFNTDSQSPSSPVISGIIIGSVDGEIFMGLLTKDEYPDCTIKLDTGAGLSENTHISYSSLDKAMFGKISNQMYTHLKEAVANSEKVTLTITVVS